MPRYRTFHHLEEYLVSNLPYRTYSISLKKAQPRSEEGVHKEGEETVMIKLVDQEDLRVRKEREGKLALEEKKASINHFHFRILSFTALSQVMLNLKIVMKVLKAQGKNYLAEPDVIVHKSALL